MVEEDLVEERGPVAEGDRSSLPAPPPPDFSLHASPVGEMVWRDLMREAGAWDPRGEPACRSKCAVGCGGCGSGGDRNWRKRHGYGGKARASKRAEGQAEGGGPHGGSAQESNGHGEIGAADLMDPAGMRRWVRWHRRRKIQEGERA